MDVTDLLPHIGHPEAHTWMDAGPTLARRAAIAAFALVIAAAAIGFAFRAFQSSAVSAVSNPSPLLANGDLYFAVGGGEAGVAYEAVSPDGTNRRTIFSIDPANVGWPQFGDLAWSPDGTKIAFVSRLEGHVGMFTANSDGSDITLLDADPTTSWPSWSPDGTKIAFSSARSDASLDTCPPGDYLGGGASCPSDIYVVNADGSSVQRLTTDPSPEFGPVWSPDGSQIAFTRQGGGSNLSTNIAVMNADGSGVREVAATAVGSDFRPSWSPDGSSLVYASIRNEDWGIYVTDLAAGNERGLITTTPSSVNDPAWSPDGTQIAYSSGYVDLMVMNVDGSASHLVAHDPNEATIDNIAWRALPTGAPSLPLEVSAKITQTIDTGLRFPEGVVVDGEGVWVATNTGTSEMGDLLRLDPRTGAVVARISMPSLPGWEFGGAGITAGLGSVWVAAGGLDQHTSTVLYRIDPATNTLAETIDVGPGSAADVWADDTGMWVLTFADSGNSMWLYRLDEATHAVLSRTTIPANWSNTVVGAGGWIWVLGNTDDSDGAPPGTLFRIDPSSGMIVDQFDPARGDSFFLSVSGDRLWFFKDDGLYAFDASSGREVIGPFQLEVAGPIQLPGRCCSRLVSDGTGGVWVISATGDGPGAKGVWHVSADGIVDQHSNGNPGDLADGIAAAFDPSTASVWIVHFENTVSRLEITSAA